MPISTQGCPSWVSDSTDQQEAGLNPVPGPTLCWVAHLTVRAIPTSTNSHQSVTDFPHSVIAESWKSIGIQSWGEMVVEGSSIKGDFMIAPHSSCWKLGSWPEGYFWLFQFPPLCFWYNNRVTSAAQSSQARIRLTQLLKVGDLSFHLLWNS